MPRRAAYARETLDIYSPLANRLGVWQLKWELEDLSFRFLEPELYKRIASMLDEKRVERERYIAGAIDALVARARSGRRRRPRSPAGRSTSIRSGTRCARRRSTSRELYDVRALRVIVPRVKDCYTALGVVHNLWQPIPKEFDDYISRPKGNLYQSLHTAVIGPRGQDARGADPHRGDAPARRVRRRRALALQGEAARPSTRPFEQKIAWLRELLAWRDEVADWRSSAKQARLDDTVYVLTPQGKVHRPAGGRDADRLRLRAAHRPRPPLPRRARRRPHRAARHAARERPARRDRHRQDRRPVARLAERRARLREEPARAAEDPAVVQRQGACRDASRPGARMVEKELRREGARRPTSTRSPQSLGFKQARRALRRRRARRGQPAPAADRAARRGRSRARSSDGRAPPSKTAEPAAKTRRAGRRRHGPPDDPARAVLQAGAARSDPRLRHARQGRLGAPRGLREPRSASPSASPSG